MFDILLISQELFRQRYFFSYCKDCLSNYSKKNISHRMRRMREIGLIGHVKSRWLRKKPNCEGDGRDFTFVGLREVKPIIHAFFVGIVASILLLCAEILTVYLRDSSLENRFHCFWNRFEYH